MKKIFFAAIATSAMMINTAHAKVYVCKIKSKQSCTRGEGCKMEDGWKNRHIEVNTRTRSYQYCATGSSECKNASGNMIVRTIANQLVFSDLHSKEDDLHITFKFNTNDKSFMFLENIGTKYSGTSFGTCTAKN